MGEAKRAIDIQLEFLRQELDHIAGSIGRIDEITQATKTWAIVTWAGSIALVFGESGAQLQPLVSATGLIPLVFWLIDAWWRRIQRSMGYRGERISEFLNSDDLEASLEKGRLVNFTVYDPRARQYRDKVKYERYRSSAKTMLYREVAFFYAGLVAISILLGIV